MPLKQKTNKDNGVWFYIDQFDFKYIYIYIYIYVYIYIYIYIYKR